MARGPDEKYLCLGPGALLVCQALLGGVVKVETVIRKPFVGLAIVALTSLLVVSVGLNVGLAYKVQGFMSAQNARIASLEARRLKAGSAVPAFVATRVGDIDGRTETIGYANMDRPTVLYVLSPDCGWCAKNEDSVRKLIIKKSGEYRFIAVSLEEDGVEKYAAEHDFGIPLYAGISEDAQKAYKMTGTPQTIVVSPKGVVLANWNGAYHGKQKDAVEAFFKVKLPEIDLKGKVAH